MPQRTLVKTTAGDDRPGFELNREPHQSARLKRLMRSVPSAKILQNSIKLIIKFTARPTAIITTSHGLDHQDSATVVSRLVPRINDLNQFQSMS